MSKRKNAHGQADPLSDARLLEQEGDRLGGEGLLYEALEAYRQAERLNPNARHIYQKLITTHEKLKADPTADWQEEDLSEVLLWTMREQEFATPRLKYLHRELSGEDRAVTELVRQLLAARDPDEETRILETIEALGERALPALLHFILLLKSSSEPEKDRL